MGLAARVVLFAVDVVLGPSTIVTGMFLMAPFGEERLRSSLSAVTDPSQTVAQIESALDSFLVGPPQDDARGTATRYRPTGDTQQIARRSRVLGCRRGLKMFWASRGGVVR